MSKPELMARERMYPWAVPLMERIIADKQALRERERARPWHEKVEIAARVRDAIAIGREAMRKTLAAEATRKSEGHSADAAQPPLRNP